MNAFNSTPMRRLLSTLVISALSVPIGAYAADAAAPLSLQNAVGMAVKNSPKIIIQSVQVELAKADERSAGGVFNPNITASLAKEAVRGYQYPDSLQQFGSNVNVQKSDFMTDDKNNSEFKAGINKLFRNGIYADFSVTLQSSDDMKKRYDVATGVLPNMAALVPNGSTQMSDYFPAYPSIVQFILNVPLLKMRGENNIATANETNLRLKREAAEATLKQAVATIIQNVVNSYWDYRAAVIRLEYQQNSEAQIKKWVANLEKWADSTKDPKATRAAHVKEISHLQGFLTQRSVDVSKAQEAVATARANLANALGISPAEAQALGKPQDDFPLDWTAIRASYDEPALRKRWNEMAQQLRYDLKAADLEFDAANAIMLGAENDAMPKLDLALILKKQGLHAGGTSDWPALESLSDGQSKLGHAVMLSFAYPLGNDKAESLVAKTRIGKMVAEVQRNDARRGAGLAVDQAVSAFKFSLDGLESAKQQTASYVTALNSIVRGDSVPVDKVFDLVVIEKARIDAFINHINAVQTVANALTTVRFQTGTLIKEFNNVQQVSTQSLTTLP